MHNRQKQRFFFACGALRGRLQRAARPLTEERVVRPPPCVRDPTTLVTARCPGLPDLLATSQGTPLSRQIRHAISLLAAVPGSFAERGGRAPGFEDMRVRRGGAQRFVSRHAASHSALRRFASFSNQAEHIIMARLVGAEVHGSFRTARPTPTPTPARPLRPRLQGITPCTFSPLPISEPPSRCPISPCADVFDVVVDVAEAAAARKDAWSLSPCDRQ